MADVFTWQYRFMSILTASAYQVAVSVAVIYSGYGGPELVFSYPLQRIGSKLSGVRMAPIV